jgi:hypothetical protein
LDGGQVARRVGGSDKFPYEGIRFCVVKDLKPDNIIPVPHESIDQSEVGKKRKTEAEPEALAPPPAKRTKLSTIFDSLDEATNEIADFVIANIGTSVSKLDAMIAKKASLYEKWDSKLRKFKVQLDALKQLRGVLDKAHPIHSFEDLLTNEKVTHLPNPKARYELKSYPK